MRLCIPTNGTRGLAEEVYGHFGSAPYFTVYNTDSKQVVLLENNNEHHEHGMCRPLDVIAGRQVDAVLTGGMGKRAVKILNDEGIKVFLLEGRNVEEAVKKFEANKLRELTVENACGGHGCH
ncbi:MAG: NifB/NifX family molybdenum-iron cluster-binding protein [Spirochaetia bacterium]